MQLYLAQHIYLNHYLTLSYIFISYPYSKFLTPTTLLIPIILTSYPTQYTNYT